MAAGVSVTRLSGTPGPEPTFVLGGADAAPPDQSGPDHSTASSAQHRQVRAGSGPVPTRHCGRRNLQ